MLFLVYVHIGDESRWLGLTIPDFLGCFSTDDDLEAMPDVIQNVISIRLKWED